MADGGSGPADGGSDISPESEVAAIESGGAAGGGAEAGGAGSGDAAASSDPALMPGFDAGLANLSQLLQSGDIDDGELRQIADELDDPEVAGLAHELLALLDGGGAGGNGEVPADAFGGTASVVVPGLVSYRPAAAPGEGPAVPATESVFQPPGFALFQF